MNSVTIERTQTTVSVSKEALDVVDELSSNSGVSRSRLFDMAIRRFARWAQDVHPDALRQIAEYETTGTTVPYVRKTDTKRPSGQYGAVSVPSGEDGSMLPESHSEGKPGLVKAKSPTVPPDGYRTDKLSSPKRRVV